MSILAMASFRATKCCHLVGEQEVHDGVQQSPSVPDLYYILTCFFIMLFSLCTYFGRSTYFVEIESPSVLHLMIFMILIDNE